ncbi:hypothetical protein BD779DRAFT_1565234 [Infundibulicybe gibba]|nr:hypothetical protein BD779DRAFT_1565234 [Infundibulicybe gibba]
MGPFAGRMCEWCSLMPNSFLKLVNVESGITFNADHDALSMPFPHLVDTGSLTPTNSIYYAFSKQWGAAARLLVWGQPFRSSEAHRTFS